MRPVIVKLGGSQAMSPALRPWVAALAGCGGRVVLVPGGGPFADAVRDAQPVMGFDDRAAHRMAILAMEQYACALASLDPRLVTAETEDAVHLLLDQGRVPIWMPSQMVLADPDIPWSWEVTSDSLAAWLARRVAAERLLLVKHGDWGGGSIPAAEVAARGVVDAAFPRFLAASRTAAFLVGSSDHAAAAAALARGAPVGTRIA